MFTEFLTDLALFETDQELNQDLDRNSIKAELVMDDSSTPAPVDMEPVVAMGIEDQDLEQPVSDWAALQLEDITKASHNSYEEVAWLDY